MSAPATPDLGADSRIWPRLTLGTLALALGLRFLLAASGGQNYWSDEGRYHAATSAVELFSNGENKAGLLKVIGTADHLFFKVLALPLAWADARFGDSPVRAACAISLFSVATLALLGRCARLLGASRREAWLAVFFGACANCLFYYSRHLFPYDVALALCMASLAVALGPPAPWRSFLAGMLAGLGFLTYNGYWVVGGVVLVVHVARARGTGRAALRAALSGLGLAIPILGAVAAARGLGADLVASFRSFSGTVFQGDFGRGHVFVWQYLWSTEGPVLLIWLAGAAYVITRTRARGPLERPLLWVLMAASLYACLVFTADVTRTFVVYGRTARILAPFLCLSSAWAAEDLWARRRPSARVALGLLAAFAALASLNLYAPFRIVFARQFLAEAKSVIRAAPFGAFHMTNARILRPGEPVDEDFHPGKLLLVRRHPFAFRPYLFEGFNEEQRRYVGDSDIAMRLEWTPFTPPASLGGYPGPLRLRVRLSQGHAGYADPLVTTGTSPDVCTAFVRYLDEGHVSFGYDCHGSGALVSAPVALDLTKEHSIVVLFGSMLPPNPPPGAGEEVRSAWPNLRQKVLLRLDEQTVISSRAASHPSAPGDIFVGVNLTTNGTAEPTMLGTVLGIESVDLREMAQLARDDRLDSLRQDPLWLGYPGPLHLCVELPAGREGTYEPLITAGGPAAADSLCVSFKEHGALRLEFVRDGETIHETSLALESAPLQTGKDRRLDLVVSMGSLMPPDASPLYSAHPEWRPLIDHLVVQAQGKVILARRIVPSPSTPSEIRLLSNQVGIAGVETFFNGKVEIAESASPAAAIDLIPRFGTEVQQSALPLGDSSGPLLLNLQFPDRAGVAEPLLATGVTGAGDILFVRYEGSGKARFGLDHWGLGGPTSGSVDIGPKGIPHEVVVSNGALFPPASDPIYTLHPGWLRLRDWTVIGFDRRPVLMAPISAYASRADHITPGFDGIGGSTNQSRFTGEITSTAFASPDLVLGWLVAAGKVAP